MVREALLEREYVGPDRPETAGQWPGPMPPSPRESPAFAPAARDEAIGDSKCLDAGPVHELLKALHVVGNEVRLRFLEALRLLLEGRLYYELGYGSFDQYCDRELGLPHSTAHEYTRVARALDRLPRTRALFGQGELSWEQARAITRVATKDTEIAWIELAFEEPVRRLLSEVREAQRTGRDRPRERRFGLPNLLVRLCFEMTSEELGAAAIDDDTAGTTELPAPVATSSAAAPQHRAPRG